jgi:hypothetical protein
LNENINSEQVKGYILTYCSLFLQVQTGDNQAVSFKTHPNMNKELFANEYILGLKDPNRPFPTGQASDAAGVGLLKWRMQSTDESIVPLTSEFITIIDIRHYFVFMYL